MYYDTQARCPDSPCTGSVRFIPAPTPVTPTPSRVIPAPTHVIPAKAGISTPGIAFDKTEPTYYSGIMTTQRNHDPEIPPCAKHTNPQPPPPPALRMTTPTRVIPTLTRFIPRAYPRQFPHPPTSFPRRRESPPPGITFDKTEPTYYPRPMATTRNHSPRKHLAIHNLQSTTCNPQSPIRDLQSTMPPPRRRHNPTQSYTILRNPTKIRVCAHAREATAFCFLLSGYCCGSVYGVIDKIWSMGLYCNHQRPGRRHLP